MLSLVFPTYKESESLPVVLPKVKAALRDIPHEIIIVDDDSPDRTWAVAQDLAEADSSIRVIRRVGRRGLSSAVIEGWLSARGDVLAVADADGQHDLSILPQLYQSVKNTDGIAIGSRYAEGGSVGQWDERRATLSRIATRLAIRLCKVKVKDPMSGFFAIDVRLFQQIFRHLNPKGFKILLDVLIHVPPQVPVEEVPFTFGVREKGESKLSRRVQLEFLEHLYDATVGNVIPLTLVKYCIVGLAGVAVNVGVYMSLSRIVYGEAAAGIEGFSFPFIAGMEAAIVFNFLLNNSWTFSAAKLKGERAILGFLIFNFACLFGALANYAVANQLQAQNLGLILSVMAGAFVGMVWNYTMSRLLTWRV